MAGPSSRTVVLMVLVVGAFSVGLVSPRGRGKSVTSSQGGGENTDTSHGAPAAGATGGGYDGSASVLIQPARGQEGMVGLEGGAIDGTGNVNLFHHGHWGMVCDDGWDLNAAHVVCKMLGYPRALAYKTESFFGNSSHSSIWLDNVRCFGDEVHLLDCGHNPVGYHDCDHREAAGVFCSPRLTRRGQIQPGRPSPSPAPAPSPRPTPAHAGATEPGSTVAGNPATAQPGGPNSTTTLPQRNHHRPRNHLHKPQKYKVRLAGGRHADEGRVEVRLGGRWGVVCSDHWTLLEGTVACRHAGKGYAKTAIQADFFGGHDIDKLVAGVECDGEEAHLYDCFHEQYSDVICESAQRVAGVICTDRLPDLVPNATLLETSAYLQDHPLYYLQCALEENCAAPSAFVIKQTYADWHVHRRRLLRFSSSTWNFGTADFKPFSRKEDWEWHLCHMHYHSMAEFAHYDLMDEHGNRVAQGHKASFCLEDVQCLPDVEKHYVCKGFGEQGITAGCADDYLHDIDCQWIDITDVPAGNYIFRVNVNPENKVAELNFRNNAATCDLEYTGYAVIVNNCRIGRG